MSCESVEEQKHQHTHTAWLLKAPRDNDPYAKVFASHGWNVHFNEVISFTFCNQDVLLDKLMQHSEKYSGIIATSPRSLQAVSQLPMDKLDQIVRQWKGKYLFAVGTETYRHSPFQDCKVLIGEGTATHLGHLIEEKNRAERISLPLLFLCGNLRRDELPAYLTRISVPFEELVVYETCKNSPDDGALAHLVKALNDSQHCPVCQHWLLFFSPSGVESLEQRYPLNGHKGFWSNARLAAIGYTTANAIEEKFNRPADAVATAPNSESLFEAVSKSAMQQS